MQEFEVFFDGDCPLCMREIGMLRRLDQQERIRFTDIAAPGFDPEAQLSGSHEELMSQIYGRSLLDGELVTGVEVFRRLYSAVGLGWLLAPTRWPILSAVADWSYALFARHRLRLTGRCLPEGACRTV